VASHCITLSICICSLMCSFFVLVVIYINLGHVRLYHFIHLLNCRITVLAKVPGFCPCVFSTWPLISENALIQMNGAFQMKYCMGPNSAIFHLRILAEVGFEPGSPSWEAGALSITPRAHAQICKNVESINYNNICGRLKWLRSPVT